MKANKVSAIVFANVEGEHLGDLTSIRSTASVPFGARYRLIDFTLSNIVNAGISNVGVITKENYRSLMDHLGSGLHWDLDRKRGGLHILPPFNTSNAIRYSGYIDALNGARNFILRSNSEYIVISDANVVANVDLNGAIRSHVKNDADITMLWHRGKLGDNSSETMIFSFGDDTKINKITFFDNDKDEVNYGFGLYIIKTKVLIDMIDFAYQNGIYNLKHVFFADKIKKLRVFGYEHKGYISVIDSQDNYYKANLDLLNSEVRKDLFNKDRPIFTKTRDDMPTRYGTHADVKNSLIGDGSIIEGTVKNSILFRGVKVEKGAVIENCIIMQSGKIGENAVLSNTILDKNVTVFKGKVLKGTPSDALIINKNKNI